MADLLGVAGARAEPQRQVPAQVGADGGRAEPGRRQHPAVAGPAAGPGGQRAEEQGGRAALADGVHQADPLLVLVQRRPVGQAGGRRGRGGRDAGRDQHRGRALGAAEHVEQDRGGPAAERQPDQRGMRGLAERDAVQGVGAQPAGSARTTESERPWITGSRACARSMRSARADGRDSREALRVLRVRRAVERRDCRTYSAYPPPRRLSPAGFGSFARSRSSWPRTMSSNRRWNSSSSRSSSSE